jgi:homoserine dehydrogenase
MSMHGDDSSIGSGETSAVNEWRLALVGLGNVGMSVVRQLLRRRSAIRSEYGLDLVVTGVADIDGGMADLGGVDLEELARSAEGGSVREYWGRRGALGVPLDRVLEQAKPDVILEATPIDLRRVGGAASRVLGYLARDIHVVLSNKSPLAIAFGDLLEHAELGLRREPRGKHLSLPSIRFSACVGGALPTVNILDRDLAGSQIVRIEGVFNGTSQSILRQMESGTAFEEALADAQARGIVESDPELDLGGIDAACKLVIAANVAFDRRLSLSDVRREGINADTAASNSGGRVAPLARAEVGPSGAVTLRVAPTVLPENHPLVTMHPDAMGVSIYTETGVELFASSTEPGPEPAAEAMVRDVIDIAHLRRPFLVSQVGGMK